PATAMRGGSSFPAPGPPGAGTPFAGCFPTARFFRARESRLRRSPRESAPFASWVPSILHGCGVRPKRSGRRLGIGALQGQAVAANRDCWYRYILSNTAMGHRRSMIRRAAIRMWVVWFCVLACSVRIAGAAQETSTVLVFDAASLTDVVDELG